MNIGPLENLITKLAIMEREDLIFLLKHIHCTFPVDFTEEFLQDLSLERLRHITLAACVHQDKACA